MARKRPGPYVPLSVYYFDDEALMDAGEDAELMFLRMMAYAGRTPLTEGWVPERACLNRLGIDPGPETGPESSPETGPETGRQTGRTRIRKLVEVGLLVRERGGYQIVSWLRWNRSAQEMGSEREQDRKRKVALTRGYPETGPEKAPESHPETRPEPGPEKGPTKVPVPSGSTEAEAEAEADKEPALTRARALPPGWKPDKSVIDAMHEECPTIDLQAEHRKFTDHFHATGKPMKDWTAAWRNWIRRSTTMNPQPRTNGRDIDWDAALSRAAARDQAKELT